MNTMTTMIYVRSYLGASYARCHNELNLPPVTALQCCVCVCVCVCDDTGALISFVRRIIRHSWSSKNRTLYATTASVCDVVSAPNCLLPVNTIQRHFTYWRNWSSSYAAILLDQSRWNSVGLKDNCTQSHWAFWALYTSVHWQPYFSFLISLDA